jgi:hypothetical protein
LTPYGERGRKAYSPEIRKEQIDNAGEQCSF